MTETWNDVIERANKNHEAFKQLIADWNAALERGDSESAKQLESDLKEIGAWVDDNQHWRSPVDDGSGEPIWD